MPGFIIADPKTRSPVSYADASGRQEFYYKYTWEVESFFEEKTELTLSNPLFYLKDATLPTYTANTDSIVSGSLEYKWAKSVVWEDIKISWYDSTGLIERVKKWRQQVWNPQIGIRPGSAYKKMSKLGNHLPTYDGTPNKDSVTWILYNSWPKIIKYGDLTYTQSDVKIIEMTIAYDWADERYRYRE